VDATGAGDAFAAGFLDAWLVAGDPAAALARGIAAGTLAVAQPGGATRVPDRASLLRLAAQVTVHAPPARKRA
jgi:sugar/nucleoside kinase (ribokinase family)